MKSQENATRNSFSDSNDFIGERVYNYGRRPGLFVSPGMVERKKPRVFSLRGALVSPVRKWSGSY